MGRFTDFQLLLMSFIYNLTKQTQKNVTIDILADKMNVPLSSIKRSVTCLKKRRMVKTAKQLVQGWPPHGTYTTRVALMVATRKWIDTWG